MRRSEPIEEMGYFWSPENPENGVQGILRISEAREISLELQDKPGSSSISDLYEDLDDNNCIFGLIQDGFVSLKGCFVLSHGPRGKFPNLLEYMKLSASLALTGFDDEDFFQEDPKFHSVKFSVSNLDEWVGIKRFRFLNDFGFQFHDVENEVSVTCRFPKNILLCSINYMGINLEINLRFGFPFVPERNILKQVVDVMLSVEKPQPFGYFEDLLFKLRNFFTFAMNDQCFVGNMRVISPDENEISCCNIYYSRRFHVDDEEKIIRDHDMLFTFEDIKNQINEVLSNWLKGHKEYNEAFYYYHLSAYNKHRYGGESIFLDFVRCVKILSKEKSLSQKDAIDELVKPFSDLFEEDFSERVKDIRNYFEHPENPSQKSKFRGFKELLELTMSLEFLLKLHLLKTLGLDEKCKEKAKKKYLRVIKLKA